MNKLILFLILPLFLTSCVKEVLLPNLGYVCNRELTTDEMNPPKGVYQAAGNMERTRRVQFNAPRTKPHVEWSKNVQDTGLIMKSMKVDSKGGVWFSDKKVSNFAYTNKIFRLNPDGSLSSKKKFPMTVFEVNPIIALNEAVICIEIVLDKNIGRNVEDCAPICLECIDSEGKTIWRTDTFCSSASVQAYLIPQNRILIYVNSPDEFQYNIYSLKNGKLLDSIVLPDTDSIYPIGPFLLPDNTWVALQRGDDDINYLTRFDSDLSTLWQHKLPITEYGPSPPFISGETTLVGYKGFLRAVNSGDGELIWEHKKEDGRFIPVGVMPDGNFLVRAYKTQESAYQCITPEGQEIWSFPWKELDSYLDFTEMFIYQNGEILFGYHQGIALIDANGTLIWNITGKELGLMEGDEFHRWELSPSVDNRIVASCRIYKKGYFIYSLI